MEAAEIDGAGPVTRFRRVIMPMISPAIFFNVTITMIGAFQIYESIIVLTGRRAWRLDPVDRHVHR